MEMLMEFRSDPLSDLFLTAAGLGLLAGGRNRPPYMLAKSGQ
jgi:hypothetical protein